MAELEKNDLFRLVASESGEVSVEILALLAHELRNPLAPIRNGAELLRSICSDPAQVRAAEMISRQVVHLTRLLDDLLDAQRLRRGLVVLQRQSVDIDSIIADALDAVRPSIDARRQNLLVSMPSASVRLHCDPTRLLQVLQNLLNNANRFTAEGGTIRFKAEVDDGQLGFEVSDNGEGIDAALLPRIFNIFAQGHQPLHRPDGGLGVGLALARNIVEMHGGTISADSAGRGKGSQFVVRLPIVQAPTEPPGMAANAHSVDCLQLLVVDDNSLIAMSLADCLMERGHIVEVAGSAEAALARVEEFHPHAAILDIGLPGMDGFELAQRLRQRFPEIVLLAVSGYGHSMLQGMDASVFANYLLKPASPERIASLIEAELRIARRRSEGGD